MEQEKKLNLSPFSAKRNNGGHTCELGVSLTNRLEALEPLSCAVHADRLGLLGAVPAQLQKSKVSQARRSGRSAGGDR